ncbi:MAG: CYTH domain-containing protein [Candidatus Eremiobacteraeota bacterium]|nr:CYTH domain-containing protein [Candidatus Eremiobacteraeota bacterium]
MAEKETEFKYLLSAEDYRKVAEALGKPQGERRFINRYFTVEGGTERRDWVLRLRVEGSRRELTLKIGREVSPGVFDSVEHNQLVDSEDPEQWLQTDPLKVLREEVSIAPILVQGESRNLRRLYSPPVKVGRVWELDRCELPNGHEFCELEIEVEALELDASRRLLEGWLGKLEVAAGPSDKTKYGRFLASLEA